MAAPVVAGTAAQIRQYFVEGWYPCGSRLCGEPIVPSGPLMRAILMNGGQTLVGIQDFSSGEVLNEETRPYDNSQNMGRVNLLASLPLEGRNDFGMVVVNDKILKNGETNEFIFDINMGQCSSEMSTTLVWNDPAGFPGCTKCLINNLDLLVEQIDTNGSRLGTAFYPNGLERSDTINNAERIRIQTKNKERYRVSVTAQNLGFDVQKYSLVVTGCIKEDKIESTKSGVDSTDYSMIETLFAGGMQQSGNMVDIRALNDIKILSFNVHTSVSHGFVDVEFYTKEGSHQGFETDKSAWTFLGTAIVKARGNGIPTIIPPGSFNQDIEVKKGETRAFYITMDRKKLRYTPVNKAVGDVYKSNADLEVLVGVACKKNFGPIWERRVLNAQIVYEVDSSIPLPSIAEYPSSPPTVSPTPVPTDSPTTYMHMLLKKLAGGEAVYTFDDDSV
mmetsp:Transcript_42368/g.61896  ORF Transcript_42368/g.61896 Transcript_42368/m.61896 type:complete len:446 (-) Transcript_42368:301-1638(-)